VWVLVAVNNGVSDNTLSNKFIYVVVILATVVASVVETICAAGK